MIGAHLHQLQLVMWQIVAQSCTLFYVLSTIHYFKRVGDFNLFYIYIYIYIYNIITFEFILMVEGGILGKS